MLKKFIFLFFRVITLFDTIIKKITKKSFLIYFNEFVNNNSYKSILILNNSVKFFVPNKITEWRINTFFLKEPETLEWIDNFNKKKKLYFGILAEILVFILSMQRLNIQI
jgi:hypothetical protein